MAHASEIVIGNFESEIGIEEYVYNNINSFMESVFKEKVKTCTRQKYDLKGYIKINTNQLIPRRGVRLDLYVECESGNNYIFEIKNAKQSWRKESIKAIGQILEYSVTFPEANKLVIMSTRYEESFHEIIDKYNLPIDFVFFAQDKIYLLQR